MAHRGLLLGWCRNPKDDPGALSPPGLLSHMCLNAISPYVTFQAPPVRLRVGTGQTDVSAPAGCPTQRTAGFPLLPPRRLFPVARSRCLTPREHTSSFARSAGGSPRRERYLGTPRRIAPFPHWVQAIPSRLRPGRGAHTNRRRLDGHGFRVSTPQSGLSRPHFVTGDPAGRAVDPHPVTHCPTAVPAVGLVDCGRQRARPGP